MVRSILLLLIFSFVFLPSLYGAEGNPFKTKNPDIDKYPFVKNFIVGLGYYHRVAERLKQEADVSTAAGSELRAIQVFIDDRTLDNTELRIARNYLTSFSSSRNGLIRKVAQDTIATYDKLIAMSVSERDLWQSFYEFKKKQKTQHIDEKDFIHQQMEIALDKKEVAKLVGLELGKLAAEKAIKEVFFDRGRYKYHGRVKALADGLREAGLNF